jgi:hypothetical protein
MGCWFTKPLTTAVAAFAASPLASSSRKPIAASVSVAAASSPATPKSYTPVKRRAVAHEPLPVSCDLRFRCRKGETIVESTDIYASSVTIAGCEDCLIVLPCVVSKVIVLDCKRCAFAFGPTSESTEMRDCLDCTLVTWSAHVRVSECVNVRLAVCAPKEENVVIDGGAGATSASRAMDATYEALQTQLAQAGLAESIGEDVVQLAQSCGESAYGLLTTRRPSLVDVETPIRRTS